MEKNKSSPSTIYALNVIRRRYIEKCLNEDKDLETIHKNIKELKLNKSYDDRKGLKKYIEDELLFIWDEENKKWMKNDNNINLLERNDESLFEILEPFKLSKMDTFLLIKDIKEILTNIKRLTKDMDKIVRELVNISSSIVELTAEEITEGEVDEDVIN